MLMVKFWSTSCH